MTNLLLYNKVCFENSKTITKRYSTSFSSAIKLLGKNMHDAIHGIYGFVRFADEIVDTFHHTNQKELLAEFKTETYKAIAQGISLNPVLHAFQMTVNKYNIEHHLIESFFKSMEMDLYKTKYESVEEYNNYIFGSAEVVGLMCLHVFCEGDKEKFIQLESSAKAMGAAFQKINFLRDLKEDFSALNRVYFPNVNFDCLDENEKQKIVADIEIDFKNGLNGINQLPVGSRFGVYVAYKYYYSLFKKIKKLPVKAITQQRVRIPDLNKFGIILESYFRYKLQMIA
jgi:15-cis-phytoene synthase